MSPVSRADVGARVTARRRLPDGTVADVVGDLESWDADLLGIRRRDGELVSVSQDDIVAARVVGPSPRAALELEAVAARGWPAPDVEWFGNWQLSAAAGFTNRANCARAFGDPGTSLDEALSAVTSWYSARGLPAQVRVVVDSQLDRALGQRGWSAHSESLVCTGTIAGVLDLLAGAAGGIATKTDAVQLSQRASTAWLGLFRAGDTPTMVSDIVNGGGVGGGDGCEVAFALLSDGDPDDPGDGPLAIGRGVIEAPWVGITAVEVAPRARRRGHAKSVLSALLTWAREHGALRAYLEVLATNQAALCLYESVGFAEHHRYRYRRYETAPTGETGEA